MGKIADVVDKNPTLVLGGGVVLILLVGYQLTKKKTPSPAMTNPNGMSGDLSGLVTDGQGGHVVYVPTQTTFSTTNQNQQGVFASNDPSLTTITGPIGTTTTNPPSIIASPPTVVTGPPGPQGNPGKQGPPGPPPNAGPPHKQPPPPIVAPPTRGKNLYWDQRYSVSRGETLSSIALNRTRWLRNNKGFPGSMSISWNDLYAHNTAVINATSAAHHNPIPGGPWNDVFPGENIVIPDWR